MLVDYIPCNWQVALDRYVDRVKWRNTISDIEIFLQKETREKPHYHPTRPKIFKAFRKTEFNDVRVVIIGQDPYPESKNATGIAFFANGNRTDSLTNIYVAMGIDGMRGANLVNACPKRWAEDEGVLLLNSALTLRKVGKNNNKINIHMEPWKGFIQAVLEALVCSGRPIHFMLWGGHAKVFEYYIKAPSCRIHKAYHPMAKNKELKAFLNCRHFSAVNNILRERDEEPINWIIPQED